MVKTKGILGKKNVPQGNPRVGEDRTRSWKPCDTLNQKRSGKKGEDVVIFGIGGGTDRKRVKQQQSRPRPEFSYLRGGESTRGLLPCLWKGRSKNFDKGRMRSLGLEQHRSTLTDKGAAAIEGAGGKGRVDHKKKRGAKQTFVCGGEGERRGKPPA